MALPFCVEIKGIATWAKIFIQNGITGSTDVILRDRSVKMVDSWFVSFNQMSEIHKMHVTMKLCNSIKTKECNNIKFSCYDAESLKLILLGLVRHSRNKLTAEKGRNNSSDINEYKMAGLTLFKNNC